MSRLIATFFYSGLLRPASGTWGSLAAMPVAWGLHAAGGPLALLTALLAVIAAGWWATAREIEASGDTDPSWVVIDEVAGMWIALLPVSWGAWSSGASVLDLWPGWLTAFFAFRLFDIWKPGPVGRADKRGDATGVMLDDLIAGVFAALTVLAFAALAHGVMGI